MTASSDDNVYIKRGRKYVPFGLRYNEGYLPDGIWYVRHFDNSYGHTNVDHYLSGLYKVGIVYNYVCPICNMSKRLSGYNLDDSPFNNSNIIDLDEAFVLNNEKVLIKKG